MKRYPAYKHSGIQWLGEVPQHWESPTLARITVSRCDGPFGSGLKSEHYRESGVRVIRLQNIGFARFKGSDAVYIDTDYYGQNLGDHSVLPGDILIAGLGDNRHTIGRACVAPNDIQPAMVKADCFRYRLDRNRAVPRFIAYYLSSTSQASAEAFSTGATRARMNLSSTSRRRILLPPPHEQELIADYLDHKTSEIDTLIEKKQALIALLREQRTALINRAVTKGLNLAAPMKDSGIEWLGEVPEHWITKQLRHLVPDNRRIMYGIVLPGPHFEGGVPIVKARNCVPGGLVKENMQRTSPEIERRYVRSRLLPGDIVFSIRGSYGSAAVVTPDLEGANLTQDAARISPKNDVHSQWLYYSVCSSYVSTYINPRVVGATVKGINIRDLQRAPVVVPPFTEQIEIANYIDRQTTEIDNIIQQERGLIDLLRELRTSLISEVVTGKIDVREAVAA